ncbi:hypothetical protein TNCV_1589851 [Trichonephila clavipes]|uniref:Uncharacterized protein n=1 Tax=Trichonephila clavipes TaxID=2585209 RepID=A0A8X6V5E9_TRICX|nr:hypothetical protein TNCV_1589851 [Trichonephila clavipes]
MRAYDFCIQKIHRLQPASNVQPWAYEAGTLCQSHPASRCSPHNRSSMTPKLVNKTRYLLPRVRDYDQTTTVTKHTPLDKEICKEFV